MSNQDPIGYIKYSGPSNDQKTFDAKKAADALSGFDQALHYFILQEDPELGQKDFEIPVKIKTGSLEAVVPYLEELFSPSGLLMATGGVYLTVSAKVAAEKGLFDTPAVKDISRLFKAAMITMQEVIKIANHLGSFSKNSFKAKVLENKGGDSVIELENLGGEKIIVIKKYLDKFVECPGRLFSKNAKIVSKDRVFEIGVYDNSIEKKILITEEEKFIYYSEDENGEIIFPEFIHGKYIEVEGLITRVNEKYNTSGFDYNGHVLTVRPAEGSIIDYKKKIVSEKEDHIFHRVRLKGIIDRENKDGKFIEKRPRIIFSDLTPLVDENKQMKIGE